MPGKTPQIVRDETKDGEGSLNSCWGATRKRVGIQNGGFYVQAGVKGKKSRDNENAILAGELWDWTPKELEVWS